MATVVACTGADPLPEGPGPADVATGFATATTSGRVDGNRIVAGSGDLPGAEPTDLVIDAIPAWLVLAPQEDHLVLIVVTDVGTVLGYRLDGPSPVPVELNLDRLPEGAPPAVAHGQGTLVLAPPVPAGSTLTNPLALTTGGLAFVASDGAVIVSDAAGNRRFEIDAMLDGRLAVSAQGTLAVLTRPTDRYGHGVLGDRLEAEAVTLIALADLAEVATWRPSTGGVIESNAPLWADVDADGEDELVVTVSDARSGARLTVVDQDGTELGSSDAIGTGNRWRHLIAAGPVGPDGEIEVVAMRTPHIGGIVQFLRWTGTGLELAAAAESYSSHRLGSRNLDMAVAVDGDGDGIVEVIVPDRPRSTLVAIQRTPDGASERYRLELDGESTANLAAAVDPATGQVVLVAGTERGTVRIWR